MKKILFTIIFVFIATLSFAINYYVDATNGSDAFNGLSPSTAWKTIDRVNSALLVAGDSVLFKRGEVFRGNLIPMSGSTLGNITYGAYGTGNKPKILGSYNRHDTSYWIDEGKNIWQMTNPAISLNGPELLPNPDFNNDMSNWNQAFNSENGSSSELIRTTNTDEYFSAPAGGKLTCYNHGQTQSDIQLFTSSWPMTCSKWYKFTFKAKSTKQFTMNSTLVELMKDSSPWTNYSASQTVKDVTFTNTWSTYEFFYKANVTTSDSRITFYFGNVIPDSTTFYFDSLSFKELSGYPELLSMDVGNIIFNNEDICGVKVWEETDLIEQGEFWYDKNNEILKLYSISNPASFYSDIELALRENIIDITNKSYVVFENLDLRYGACDGVQGISTHHICIKDVDISYMGGGDQYGGTEKVRFGNGISFLAAAHDNIVERCTFNQIYDAALTAQGGGVPYEAYNIYFRNNIVRNSEYSYEFWGDPAGTYLHDIYFENNTCLYAGFGWSHAQRPNPNGAHLMFWQYKDEQTKNIYIRNNIFYESANYGSRYDDIGTLSKMIVDYNCWYESSGSLALIAGTYYDYASQWTEYQNASGQDAHSIHANPLLNPDYTLAKNSPCINTGTTTVFVTDDYNQTARPQGEKYDIGAFEYIFTTSIENIDISSEIHIYPNPANNKLTIETPQLTKESTLTILNLNGQELIRQQVKDSKTQIDISNLASGIYFVKLITDMTVEVRKIIKE